MMQANQPSLGAVTLVYTGYYLLIAIALNAALWALQRFAGFEIESSALGWMPLILGAMMAGQYYGKKVGAKPAQSYAWLAGFLFMLVSVILSLAVLYALALIIGENVGGAVAQLRAEVGNDAGLIVAFVGVFLLVIWVGQRFMFSAGAAGVVKQAARLAAKGK